MTCLFVQSQITIEPPDAPPSGSLTVTGAGDTSFDDTYLNSGSYMGHTYYQAASGKVIWYYGGNWVMTLNLGDSPTYYYTGSSDPWLGAWSIISAASPAPTVALNP